MSPYPQARRSEHAGTYFGEEVADPYRWLEDVDSPETLQWVDAENQLTFRYLNAIPQREAVRRRLTELYNYERYSAPLQVRGRVFYAYNSGLENQSVYYYQDTDGPQHVLIDPNTLSTAPPRSMVSSPTTAVRWWPIARHMRDRIGASGRFATWGPAQSWRTPCSGRS